MRWSSRRGRTWGLWPGNEGDMSPLAALAAEGVWPTSLLEGVDLIPASEQSDSALAKTVEGRLAGNRGHHHSTLRVSERANP